MRRFLRSKIFIAALFLSAANLFARPRQDMIINFPIVSACGYVFGANNSLSKFDGIEKSKPFTISSQVYGLIYDFPKCALSWNFGFDFTGIFENEDGFSDDFFSLGLTGGVGIFFNLWESHAFHYDSKNRDGYESIEVLPLTGPCIFLYPIYDAKIYTKDASRYWKWKIAADFGLNYSYSFFDIFPFVRPIAAFKNGEAKLFCDVGIAIGIAVQ